MGVSIEPASATNWCPKFFIDIWLGAAIDSELMNRTLPAIAEVAVCILLITAASLYSEEKIARTSASVADSSSSPATSASGPDVIVGDLTGMSQLGNTGSQVGLAIGISACNNGNADLNFQHLPNPDHPVVAQNLYRMSGGATNDDRFEQVGQSWVKHMFFALEQNGCGFGCSASNSGGTRLGAGCSDAESTSSNGDQNNLGSRAWINPFSGVFPGSNPNPDDHAGHAHSGVTHRILAEASDLDTMQNPGATYYAEVQCISPHEFAWCQAHAGECNMYNNVSFRRFNVFGTTSFSFVAVGSTVRELAAITAWTGATICRLSRHRESMDALSSATR